MRGSQPYPKEYDTLDGVLESLWQVLRRGVKDRHSPAHTPTIATVNAEGDPSVRTVVLRGCEPSRRTLRFHTDIRADKWTELQHQPSVGFHTYLPKAKVQIRARGIAALQSQTDATRVLWDRMHAGSRRCYRLADRPGVEVSEPRMDEVVSDELYAGYDAFGVVEIEVHRIEWLYLASRGHRRARYRFVEGHWSGQWLAP